jgi:hypothetical protein
MYHFKNFLLESLFIQLEKPTNTKIILSKHVQIAAGSAEKILDALPI